MDTDELVPVRLRLQLEEKDVVETLLWNAKDDVHVMYRFSEEYCRDVGIPEHHAQLLTEEIKKQVESWQAFTCSGKPVDGKERLEVIR